MRRQTKIGLGHRFGQTVMHVRAYARENQTVWGQIQSNPTLFCPNDDQRLKIRFWSWCEKRLHELTLILQQVY